MQQIDYTDKIRRVGEKLIKAYSLTGHAETGINGPYDDPETEVRYLAHLMVIAAVECVKFGHIDYKALVEQIGQQVLKMKCADGTYKMRQKEGKDQCNGTIGHAWLVEGLLYAYKITGDEKYLDESERIFGIHKFNEKIGLWGRPLMGNDDDAIDFTFNHELWYAATLAEFLQLRKNDSFEKQLDIFLGKLDQIITVSKEGRVAHTIYGRLSTKAALKYKVVRLRDVVRERLSRPSLRYKEIGYHLFNIMAFARLYKIYPDSYFFQTKRFKKTLEFVNNGEFFKELEADNLIMDASSHGDTLIKEEKSINIYGYPYNVPGFEAKYCRAIFNGFISEESANRLLNRQIELTWDDNKEEFGSNCHDKVSVNYRVYEYYKFLEIL